MAQENVAKEENGMENNGQMEGNDVVSADVLTEDHTKKIGCTQDAAVHDHSRVFKEWKQKVSDDHWTRMSMELIDEGLPN